MLFRSATATTASTPAFYRVHESTPTFGDLPSRQDHVQSLHVLPSSVSSRPRSVPLSSEAADHAPENATNHNDPNNLGSQKSPTEPTKSTATTLHTCQETRAASEVTEASFPINDRQQNFCISQRWRSFSSNSISSTSIRIQTSRINPWQKGRSKSTLNLSSLSSFENGYK